MDKKHLQHNILEEKYSPSVWKDVMIKIFGAKKLHQQPVPYSSKVKSHRTYLGLYTRAKEI